MLFVCHDFYVVNNPYFLLNFAKTLHICIQKKLLFQ